MNQASDTPPELRVLAALGLGLDAVLMSEPRLFMDRRLLATLLVELEDELDEDGMRAALFQVGLLHGLRDAQKALASGLPDGAAAGAHGVLSPSPTPTPLAIQLGARRACDEPGSFEIPGRWPESYEAEARLAKLGPEHTPSCWLSAGYTSGWLSGTLDADVLARELTCSARGDAGCCFVARELSSWQSSDDPEVQSLLRTVCFQTFRKLAMQRPERVAQVEYASRFDPDDPAVHIWGPVMVLPVCGLEDALETVEMLARDPEAGTIRAVVMDLRGALLDEGLAAAALEQLLASIRAWGAEPILTGVAPLTETTLVDLEDSHVLVCKDLSSAIARAFQIAEVQRRSQ